MKGSLSDQSLIYLQIAQMLEDDILRRVYTEDEQVPSTNELARGYNINPATAAKGINMLVAEGILYKRRGIGMFVSKGASELIRQKRRDKFTDDFIRPMMKEAEGLGLSSEELIAMVQKALEKGER